MTSIMRSLTLKLTLAFLLLGVLGVGIFAVLMVQRTQMELTRYLSARDQSTLVDALTNYYTTHENWQGVTNTLLSNAPLSFYMRGAVLTDADGVVQHGTREHPAGTLIVSDTLKSATVIRVNDMLAGYVLLTPLDPQPPDDDSARPDPSPPENDFSRRVLIAAATSAGITVLIALVLGVILARTLTRPIKELIRATQTMASGKLDQRVQVRSRDEIGMLGTSFNKMSSDLARSSQTRKQMTADLAHDLRTPLSILRGYTEGLKEQRLQGSPQIFGIMHDEVVHLQRLVEDLRTLSLADAGELGLNRRAVDPRALLERTGLAYIMQAEEKGIVLRVEAPDGLPSISVDTDRMTQVLNNLVSNALKHTAKGEILLSANTDGGQVVLRVQDSGAGIEAEHLPFVFDRLYRADPARQRNDWDSSGLGLAIAKAIIEAHGGTITAESTEGKGSVFTVRFTAITA
jgi:two-component system, OmpR family, sensor histidine kinase BaeS